ncbi:hypothetical protein [Photobacterium leiognathi]|uniref:hypothetical protein n=1 Tax=Photobacterium leiognathi TaxID=553611 RepID=UPI0029811D84|nr:hypothetical protein [Photobacterium leiognathi]
MKRLLSLTALSLSLLSGSTFASSGEVSYFSWSDDNAASLYLDGGIDNSKGIIVKIGQSEGGDKRLYINRHYPKGDNFSGCIGKTYEDDIGYLYYEIDNQAVKMYAFCNTDSSNNNYVSATPVSNKGQAFLLNKFKSKQYVKIKAVDNLELNISAKGFTKAWNSPANNPI